MDMIYIPALASFSRSASGTLASILTNWVTQRRKDRIRHTLRAASQREELYNSFIEAASNSMPMHSSATNPRFRSSSTCSLL